MSDVEVGRRGGDLRVCVDDVMNAKRAELIELKMNLIDLVCQDPSIDDLFLLRYLLSFQTVPAAMAAVRYATKYRMENASWLASAKDGEYTKAPAFERLQKHLSGGPHAHENKTYIQTTIHGAPLVFVRAGLTDTTVLMNEFTQDDIVKFMLWDKEVSFWKCDAITRREGMLTKVLVVMDLTNMKLFGNDQRFFAALGESSKISDQLHPQLVQRTAIINAGDAMKWMWQVARLFLSKRTVEKISVCVGFDKAKGANACPYASAWTNTDELPTFVGGKCEKEKGTGCVGGLANDFVGLKNNPMQ